jgi:hypothetical protein
VPPTLGSLRPTCPAGTFQKASLFYLECAGKLGEIEMVAESRGEKEAINELQSLGVKPKKKSELNDEAELKELADSIKQSMYHDYKLAYSEKGDKHKEEAESTVKT